MAKGEGSSFKPGFTWGGEFSVPSYRAWQRVQHAFLFQPFGGTARFFRAVKHTLRQEMGGNGRDQLREVAVEHLPVGMGLRSVATAQ